MFLSSSGLLPRLDHFPREERHSTGKTRPPTAPHRYGRESRVGYEMRTMLLFHGAAPNISRRPHHGTLDRTVCRPSVHPLPPKGNGEPVPRVRHGVWGRTH